MFKFKLLFCFSFFSYHQLLSQNISYQLIYSSSNMNDYKVTDECNPGGGTNCNCSISDAGIEFYNTHIAIISNTNQKKLWINSIGYFKFIDSLPDGKPINVSQYKYSFQTKMTTLPKPDTAQLQNSQAVHLMMQLYNGSGLLWPSSKEAREGAIYWELNPWNVDFGKIKVYTTNFQLMETGITLNPDTNWHKFGLEIDYQSLKYLKIYIDTIQTDISHIPILVKPYPGWGNETVLGFTAESMATWPGDSCKNIFTWRQQFKEAELYIADPSSSSEKSFLMITDSQYNLIQNETYITIETLNNFMPEKVKIWDSIGRLIFQKKITTTFDQIPIHQIKDGIYFIEIVENSNTKRMKKIVIIK